jgi:(1->4)-alpha-D-glucan 1-alpha-D-glucosylmutase
VGRDLAVRGKLGLFPDRAARDRLVAAREEDRARLLRALQREELPPQGCGTDLAPMAEMNASLTLAVHAFLARSPGQLMLVQLEDVIGVRDQANLPATTDEHPNWRRRLSLALERWPASRRFARLAAAIGRERSTR